MSYRWKYRLHSLFSINPAQTVNEATVHLVEFAVAGCPVDREQVATSLRQLIPQVLAAWERTNRRRVAIATVAESVGVPPAVAQFVLAHEGVMRSDTAGTDSGGRDGGGEKLPDWSFQDDAVRACLHELAASPNTKSAVVVPTGGSKTRIALRTAFTMLAHAADQSSKVLWVTHRKNLRSQTHRELQRMLSAGIPGLPANAAALLANRIDFIMVGQLTEALLSMPALVIIDEAHHAAAKSYQPVFNVPFQLRALFLTATPNRTDGLPLGIDSIGYTVTYRALADRGVILLPEFQEFPVADFDWSPKNIADLADAVIDRSADSFTKTLVLAPRVDRVEEFYDALVARLEEVGEHPLSVDDIGFVHGRRNSRGCDNEEILAILAEKPRAILVSAQLLIEEFDDPAINAVVMT